MKTKLLLITLMAFAFAACDAPRSQKALLSSKSSNGLDGSNGGVDLGSGSSGNITTPTDGTTTTGGVTIPSDATHCAFSKDGINGFESSSTHIGSYTLCQSSTDKTIFYFQIKTPPVTSAGDVQLCFIPHTTSSSQSLYIGNPMCGSFTNPKEVKKITFVKYSQYSGALINSVMIFKDTKFFYQSPFNGYFNTLDAYKACMNALAYGNSNYCTAFKNTNQYVMKSF